MVVVIFVVIFDGDTILTKGSLSRLPYDGCDMASVHSNSIVSLPFFYLTASSKPIDARVEPCCWISRQTMQCHSLLGNLTDLPRLCSFCIQFIFTDI
jgi:hypothetical protein